MPSIESNQLLLAAAAACEDKKAEDIRILALDPAESGLTDYFLICNGTNDRQNVAITDEIELRLKREFGVYPNSVEGRRQAEWILMDYVDFIVHVFSAGEARLLRPRASAQIRNDPQRRRLECRVERPDRRKPHQGSEKSECSDKDSRKDTSKESRTKTKTATKSRDQSRVKEARKDAVKTATKNLQKSRDEKEVGTAASDKRLPKSTSRKLHAVSYFARFS